MESEPTKLGSGVPAHNPSAVLEKVTASDKSMNTGGPTIMGHKWPWLSTLMTFLMEHFTVVFKY